MKKLGRWTCVLGTLLGLALAGCSGPPPLPPRREKAPESVSVAAAPQGILAPVDEWRRNLDETLPSPWRLESIEDQITAPAAWTRLRGDRGLALNLTAGSERQVFWVMPASFKGEAETAQAPRERARSETFVLFEPASDAPGWSDSQVVEQALGFGSE